ncbi:MAG: SIR2 family protein [Methanophagales archaeon]|nr:SIR2 family protein [Methanophagales archaeon]
MLVLFLGAGFSKWAADLPLTSQLFDFEIEPWGPREYKKLEIVKSLKHNWDITHPYGLNEQFIADALNFQEKDKKAVLWYLVRGLSEPFIWKEYHAQKWRRHVLMIDENRRFNVPGVVKAQNFLQRFYGPSLVGIITTNYDMVVEYALGTKGFNYGIPNQTLAGRGPYPVSQWRNPVTLKGKIPLAKIHGSISWDEHNHYTDGRRGLTGNALIVAPTPKKQPPDSLKFVWDLTKEILRKATRMIVFGFAFNPYDEAVLNLLKSESKNLESVLLVNIESSTEAARSLWPSTKIVSAMPPPDGNKEIQNWQQKWLGI